MANAEIGTLWLIGCGNMGSALLRRWYEDATAASIVVVDPAGPAVPDGVTLLPVLPAPGALPPPDVVVLAVKPQAASTACAGLPAVVGPSTVAVSIMAGTPLANVRALAGVTDAVRAMPNTPAALGKGVTALFTGATNKSVSAMAEMLFSPAGATVWLDSEGQFDAVTALSGSGPAYVFRFIEALGAAGEAAGLPVDLAECLARATVIGAAALAESDPRGIAELRQAVTSPGGTTEAGLEALDSDPGLPQLMRNTIRAAATRSRELADNR